MTPKKTAFQQIIDKDLADIIGMDEVEFCILHSVASKDIANKAAELRAGWLAEIERLEQRVKELESELDSLYRHAAGGGI